jgi:predicted DNA-binding transcriptional regulator YafY
VSHPTTRVLAMLELLQARRQLSGAELAAGLGVDQRTVRRYALRLADLGIPVTAERGRYGGYRLLPGYRLPPLMLTDDEAAAVVIGLLAAERLGHPVVGIHTALAKIQRVLPATLSERVAALRQTLGFNQRQYRPAATAGSGAALSLVPPPGQHQRVRPYVHEIEVVLATTLKDAQRRIPPTVATLAETDGGVLVTGRAEHLPALAAMLAGLGWPFTVRRPAALRDEVKALSDRLRTWSEA